MLIWRNWLAHRSDTARVLGSSPRVSTMALSTTLAKSPPFHGGESGSTPDKATNKLCRCSSVGRAVD